MRRNEQGLLCPAKACKLEMSPVTGSFVGDSGDKDGPQTEDNCLGRHLWYPTITGIFSCISGQNSTFDHNCNISLFPFFHEPP